VCQAAEHRASEDSFVEPFLQLLDLQLKAFGGGRRQRPQKLFEAHLDFVLERRVLDKRSEVFPGLGQILVPSQEDGRRADTGISLNGERNRDVGQALCIAGEQSVIKLASALASQVLRNRHTEEAMLPAKIEILGVWTVLLLDVTLVGETI